jgi:hypothetical protein
MRPPQGSRRLRVVARSSPQLVNAQWSMAAKRTSAVPLIETVDRKLLTENRKLKTEN